MRALKLRRSLAYLAILGGLVVFTLVIVSVIAAVSATKSKGDFAGSTPEQKTSTIIMAIEAPQNQTDAESLEEVIEFLLGDVSLQISYWNSNASLSLWNATIDAQHGFVLEKLSRIVENGDIALSQLKIRSILLVDVDRILKVCPLGYAGIKCEECIAGFYRHLDFCYPDGFPVPTTPAPSVSPSEPSSPSPTRNSEEDDECPWYWMWWAGCWF
jgi:hypothetical protein